MADLTITAASVVPGANARFRSGPAGAAITAGEVVYPDASGDIQLADNNASAITAGSGGVIGLAVCDAAASQRVTYVTLDDDLTIGATVAVGTSYYLSATAGKIAPEADLVTGNYATLLGVGKSTTKISYAPIITGATHA